MAVLRPIRRPFVPADLAVPDRDQRVLAGDRKPRPPAAALGSRPAGREPGRPAGRRDAGSAMAPADPRRAAAPRNRRSRLGRHVTDEHTAGPDRRLAVLACPAARGADLARRTRVAGGGGRRAAGHDRRRRQQRAAASPGSAATGGPHRQRDPRTRPTPSPSPPPPVPNHHPTPPHHPLYPA